MSDLLYLVPADTAGRLESLHEDPHYATGSDPTVDRCPGHPPGDRQPRRNDRQAIDLFTQTVAIAHDIESRYLLVLAEGRTPALLCIQF